MPEIIDAVAHVQSHEVLDTLEQSHSTVELTSLRNAPRLFDADARVEYLDRYGIDKQVVNLAAPNMWHGVDPDDALEATRVANDEIRRFADEHPDRFVPVGTVPFLTDEYVDEARRCVEDLGLHGVQIFSNVNGRMLDHEDFEPFYSTIDDLDVPLWIHPQLHDWHDYDEGETWIYKMLGWPFDTSVAVARLVFSGVMERHQNLELVTHHLGGTLPFLVGRVKSWYRTRQEEPELYTNPDLVDLPQSLDAYFDRVYGDTAVSSQGEAYPLRCGYEFFGADNVLYSADHPFGPDKGEYWTQQIIPLVEDMDIPASEKEQIFAGNLRRLLDL